MSGMLKKVRHSRCATTLVELAIASAAGSVIALVAFATVEMSRRETAAAFDRTEMNRNAFAVLRAIEHNVMRAATIAIPDPDYPQYESMEVTIPLETGEVRRGFRRVDGEFIHRLQG